MSDVKLEEDVRRALRGPPTNSWSRTGPSCPSRRRSSNCPTRPVCVGRGGCWCSRPRCSRCSSRPESSSVRRPVRTVVSRSRRARRRQSRCRRRPRPPGRVFRSPRRSSPPPLRRFRSTCWTPSAWAPRPVYRPSFPAPRSPRTASRASSGSAPSTARTARTERWALVLALSRFGSFSDLGLTTSSSTDVYPNTPTFSFHGSTYSSQYLAFDGVETTSNVPNADGYAALDTPTAEEQALQGKYDAPPTSPRTTPERFRSSTSRTCSSSRAPPSRPWFCKARPPLRSRVRCRIPPVRSRRPPTAPPT